MKNWNKTIVATICIAILLALALWRGIDGALLSAGIAAIAGLGGYALGKKKSS